MQMSIFIKHFLISINSSWNGTWNTHNKQLLKKCIFSFASQNFRVSSHSWTCASSQSILTDAGILSMKSPSASMKSHLSIQDTFRHLSNVLTKCFQEIIRNASWGLDIWWIWDLPSFLVLDKVPPLPSSSVDFLQSIPPRPVAKCPGHCWVLEVLSYQTINSLILNLNTNRWTLWSKKILQFGGANFCIIAEYYTFTWYCTLTWYCTVVFHVIPFQTLSFGRFFILPRVCTFFSDPFGWKLWHGFIALRFSSWPSTISCERSITTIS